MVAYDRSAETGGLLQVLGQPWLHGEFQENLGYSIIPCFRIMKTRGSVGKAPATRAVL